jgi:hypothetical protein
MRLCRVALPFLLAGGNGTETSAFEANVRGRPRNFDEMEAVEKAIQLFWSKGYDGVTIDDLARGRAAVARRPAPLAAELRVLETAASKDVRVDEHSKGQEASALLGAPRCA